MFTGKTAVVTGASIGIGRAIATMLSSNGASVALIARPGPRLDESTRIVQRAGGTAVAFPCNLRDPSAVEGAARAIERRFGSPHIIVNCAGVWHDSNVVYAGKELQDTPIEEIREVFEVTLLGAFLLTRALLPGILKRRSGKILQISGTFESGAAGWLHYYVAKKALEHFSEGLAQELRKHEIQVNTVSPSDTLTEAYRHFFPDTPKEQCVSPEEIADIAKFLLSDAADHITGACVAVRSKTAH